jgi:hypothetical protein
MTRSELESAVAAAIDAQSEVGLRWWSGSEMAPIAIRRWSSFARRVRRKNSKAEDRALDLAKGLQAHFEPAKLRTPLSEWLHLATILAKVFASDS